MSNASGRLLSLLSLLQTPRLWPGSELAQRLGVSGRTVRRDIDRLRELGYRLDQCTDLPQIMRGLPGPAYDRRCQPAGAYRSLPTAGLNGIQALDLAHTHLPDLVLLDHHVSGSTGLQVAGRLRADARTA